MSSIDPNFDSQMEAAQAMDELQQFTIARAQKILQHHGTDVSAFVASEGHFPSTYSQVYTFLGY